MLLDLENKNGPWGVCRDKKARPICYPWKEGGVVGDCEMPGIANELMARGGCCVATFKR